MRSKITIILFIGLISCYQTTNQEKINSDFNISDLAIHEIPESIITIDGELLLAKSWVDKNGKNILIVRRKGPLYKNSFETYVELFAEQYIMDDDDYMLLWDIYDFVHCSEMWEIYLGLLFNSTQITDLDGNGITETTLIYKLSCRTDVSPSDMKLLMHENKTKMGLRGSTVPSGYSDEIKSGFEPDRSKIDINEPMWFGGRYENENDFHGKPKEFLEFARDLWMRFVIE